LKEAILADIQHGPLRPGDCVGSQAELERWHRVSRITVRQAVNGLVQDGELDRGPGKGTYVSARTVAPVAAFTNFSENMRSLGIVPSYRVIMAGLCDPEPRVREELRLGEMEQAFQLQRVLLADGEPIGLQSGFYPQVLLASGDELLTTEHLSSCSLNDVLERRLRLQLWRAEEMLESAIAERKEVELLALPAGVPVLVVRRLSFLESGHPIETVKLVFRGDKYRYRVDLFRGQRQSASGKSSVVQDDASMRTEV
jgi:GntR family transcriptional regulator